ncbi:MAG: hypothetical protein AUI14_13815 [Actinobacteria bacterium 13_2_20CM_2_71_6]|nr:MAG: hypothetical protein AUI14_13815 [Actinobacteria bacterium 13_2_20CM_2_71_6]
MCLLMGGADLGGGQALLEEALTRFTAVAGRDDGSLALTRLSLAVTLLYGGDRQRAGELCRECDAFCQAHGDRWFRSSVLVGSALVALAGDDPARASAYLRESLPLRVALGDTAGLAQSMELMGRAAATGHDPERAARLTGAAHRVWREVGRYQFGSAHFRERVTESAAHARGDLGERAYESAYQQGFRLPLDEAVSYALGTGQPAQPPPKPGPASPLTRRERQVADLIAEGLSNRQIAVRLVISQRTAESHTENILRKLGFTSRIQVAAWVAEQRGTPAG